jgi:hypothetical protein
VAPLMLAAAAQSGAKRVFICVQLSRYCELCEWTPDSCCLCMWPAAAASTGPRRALRALRVERNVAFSPSSACATRTLRNTVASAQRSSRYACTELAPSRAPEFDVYELLTTPP